ncbi:DUF3592 domain-containing protein [Actinomadura sp. 7K507]|uniref:DUF3592 domain-containing protein n=1 Tax=Actinomadura sp. 7K507 TaxID=2530365 RepID=UPI0010477A0C|nr:DUF3592 domain-containing protein [Actinomadura sp. 7K507]TDC97816.1 DUF3592 domain-containing protein [Actinomadura sp. 7K507]
MYALIPILACSGILLALGWLLVRDWWSLARRGTAATGLVVEYRRRGPTEVAGKQITAIFEFATAEGRSVEAVSYTRTLRTPRPGEEVPVFYDPADPAEKADLAKVLRFKLVAGSALLVLATIMLVAGTLSAFGF